MSGGDVNLPLESLLTPSDINALLWVCLRTFILNEVAYASALLTYPGLGVNNSC
jgi:hypothetical protein